MSYGRNPYDGGPNQIDESPRGRQRSNRQAYQQIQEVYEDRRNSTPDGLGVSYDESQFGQSIFDIDNPIERDPQYRKEVFSEMGAALRQQLLETRGLPADQRIHVERRDGGERSGPSTIREARKIVTQARVRHNDELFDNQGQYRDSYPDDDDQDEEYDEYEPQNRRRKISRRDPYEDLEPAEEVYDPNDDESDDWQAAYEERRRREAQDRRRNQPVQRDNHEADRRRRLPSESAAPRPRQVSAPNTRTVRDRGYSTQSPRPGPNQRRTAPMRQPAPVPQQRRRIQTVSNYKPVQEQSRARPSRPEFLGPDGRIPRNPCGAPLYVFVGGQELAIECNEERRGSAPPWHVNMPHIARIADPSMNAANACFVWYYKEEVPT